MTKPLTATEVRRNLAEGLARAAAAAPPWPPPSVQKWLDDCAARIGQRMILAGLLTPDQKLRLIAKATPMTPDEIDAADIQRLREDAEAYRIQWEGADLRRKRLQEVWARLQAPVRHVRWIDAINVEVERQTELWAKASAGYWRCRHEADRLERQRLAREG